MNVKLIIILSIIFVLGFGYSNYLPTSIQVGEREYTQSHLPTTIETITIFLLLIAIISFWLVERKNNSSIELAFKTLGSLLLPASLISIFLLALYRMQFTATVGGTLGVERISILGQTLPTDEAATWFIFIVLIFSIIYLNLKSYLSAVRTKTSANFWKPFTIGVVASLVLGMIVGQVMAYGHYGESSMVGIIVPFVYLVGGFITSLTASSMSRFQSKKQFVS